MLSRMPQTMNKHPSRRRNSKAFPCYIREKLNKKAKQEKRQVAGSLKCNNQPGQWQQQYWTQWWPDLGWQCNATQKSNHHAAPASIFHGMAASHGTMPHHWCCIGRILCAKNATFRAVGGGCNTKIKINRPEALVEDKCCWSDYAILPVALPLSCTIAPVAFCVEKISKKQSTCRSAREQQVAMVTASAASK